MRTFRSRQGLDLVGDEAGDPENPAVVFFHGGCDHCRNWDWVAARLRDRYRIIAPDLRGHGDSAWSPDGNYTTLAYIYDLAQLIQGQRLAPVPIIAHSLGAHIASRYAGTYPENVARLVAIEGLGLAPAKMREREALPLAERTKLWVDQNRQLAGRQSRRYATIEDALTRMQAANKHLSPAQARHLTERGIIQNEDGTLSWKFDNYVRVFTSPQEATLAEMESLWARITCPTLLVHGQESWASNPAEDGRAAHFPNARVVSFAGAGHWVHHDRLDAFMAEVEAFL